MMNSTLPYLIPMFLGMTFDARSSKPGIDIFKSECIVDPVVTPKGSVKSRYTLTQSNDKRLNALNINGELSLKIKSGLVDFAGKGSYIKNEIDFKNKIEILTTLKYESQTLSLKCKDTKEGWMDKYTPSVLGTHYVSAITYGAELIASARVVVNKDEYLQNVTAEVDLALNNKTEGEGNELVAGGKLDNLEKTVKNKANIEVSYYGTVPLKSIPNTVKGLQTLITNFSQQIEDTGMKEGVAMTLHLSPLTDLVDSEEEKAKFRFLKNEILEVKLRRFEEKFDDLRQSRLDLLSWAKSLPQNTEPSIQEKIGNLLKDISVVLEVFYNTIWVMDLTKGPEQLQTALNAYNSGSSDISTLYSQKVTLLRAELEPLINWDDLTSDTYVQWGNDNCTGPSTVVLYKGFVMSSVNSIVGGMSSYACAPESMQQAYEVKEDSRHYIGSHIAGKRYTKLDRDSNPFLGPHAREVPEQGIPCAQCYSSNSATIAMFPARDKCPETWVSMYKGYLMSAQNKVGSTSRYICVDETPSKPYEMKASTRDSAALTIIKSEGSLPSREFPNDALVKCIVCSSSN